MTYGTGVSAASDISLHREWVTPLLGVLAIALLFYVIGRVHQFFKRTLEREQAYRDGYNTATRSLFSLATRVAKHSLIEEQLQRPRLPPPVAMRGRAPVNRPRHRAREDDSQDITPHAGLKLHESA